MHASLVQILKLFVFLMYFISDLWRNPAFISQLSCEYLFLQCATCSKCQYFYFYLEGIMHVLYKPGNCWVSCKGGAILMQTSFAFGKSVKKCNILAAFVWHVESNLSQVANLLILSHLYVGNLSQLSLEVTPKLQRMFCDFLLFRV